jgi:hypothetical protein
MEKWGPGPENLGISKVKNFDIYLPLWFARRHHTPPSYCVQTILFPRSRIL